MVYGMVTNRYYTVRYYNNVKPCCLLARSFLLEIGAVGNGGPHWEETMAIMLERVGRQELRRGLLSWNDCSVKGDDDDGNDDDDDNDDDNDDNSDSSSCVGGNAEAPCISSSLVAV
ncbi:hypothetical protein ACHAW6_003568 [Cyclotella cf. meneghiniana]